MKIQIKEGLSHIIELIKKNKFETYTIASKAAATLQITDQILNSNKNSVFWNAFEYQRSKLMKQGLLLCSRFLSILMCCEVYILEREENKY